MNSKKTKSTGKPEVLICVLINQIQ